MRSIRSSVNTMLIMTRGSLHFTFGVGACELMCSRCFSDTPLRRSLLHGIQALPFYDSGGSSIVSAAFAFDRCSSPESRAAWCTRPLTCQHLAPMTSPAKQRSISDFFQPHVPRNTIPTKRPSPNAEKTEQKKSTSRNVAPSTTPKTGSRVGNRIIRTPPSSALSPSSIPRSGASQTIPIRSPRPKGPVQSPSTYKQGLFFGIARKQDPPSPRRDNSISFADLPASTHAVIKDGALFEILDSDEDDTESLKSLESLERTLFTIPDKQVTSRGSSPEIDDVQIEAERVKTLFAFTRGRSDPLVGKERLRALYAKERAAKFDISGVIGDHFDYEAIEQKVLQSRAEYDASKSSSDAVPNSTLDGKLLATVASGEDGGDGVSRFMTALERTEALAADPVFLFFGVSGLNDWRDDAPAPTVFPDAAIPTQLWRAGDDDARSRAFKSGYVADLGAKGHLPDEVLSWTFNNIVLEQQDDVRESYLECLGSSSFLWTRNNVTASDVQNIFRKLGADVANFQDSATIQPMYRLASKPVSHDPKYLIAALDLFRSICPDMDFMALSTLVSVVCRLAMDGQLMGDGRISQKVDEMLEVLLSLEDSALRSHIVERMLADVGRHLEDATLQAQLISHILPTSATASQVRIILARAFILGVETLHGEGTSPVNLDALTSYIAASPLFDPRRHRGPRNVDYAALRALTQVLDAAISDGGRPATFPSRREEHAFNKSVDHLADSIRSTFVSIIDTGASHMRRTEAKDALQALHWRLLYDVRTEPRPKKSIFDRKTGKLRDADEARSEEKSRDLISQYLAKSDQNRAKAVSGQTVPEGHSINQNTDPLESPQSSAERLIREQLGLGRSEQRAQT